MTPLHNCRYVTYLWPMATRLPTLEHAGHFENTSEYLLAVKSRSRLRH